MTTYEPRGGAREVLLTREPVVLVSGAAGTGKSLAALWRVHLRALNVPNSRQLILRQTAASLTSTTLHTFEGQVASQELANGYVKWFGGSARRPAEYVYANGSSVRVGGLDRPEKLLSSEYDAVFIDEATEVSAGAVSVITTRLRGKAVIQPQLMMCCNPSAPNHHLYEMVKDGRAHHITSLHQDNPYFVNADGTYTAAGKTYFKFLGGLTGTARERYLYGRWTAAEGLVYDDFREDAHVVDQGAVPAIERVFNSVDWGYNNALVWQEWGVCADGRAYLLREISRKGWLVEDFARYCRDELWRDGDGNPSLPEAVVADHDAEDRATFERHARFATLAARKAVSRGVQAVQQRLRKDGKGVPGLFVVRGGLMGRDPLAEARKTPRGFLGEVTGYVWQTERGTDGIPKEAPLKLNDHSMDAARYAIMYLDGAPPAKAGNPARPGGGRSAAGGTWSQKVG
jgi:phage terminase large subunit